MVNCNVYEMRLCLSVRGYQQVTPRTTTTINAWIIGTKFTADSLLAAFCWTTAAVLAFATTDELEHTHWPSHCAVIALVSFVAHSESVLHMESVSADESSVASTWASCWSVADAGTFT